jgi:hypothetical protein
MMTATNRRFSLLILLMAACTAGGGSLHADATASSSSGIIDVMLTPDGRTHGWLLEGTGQPVDGAIVVLRQRGADVARAVTDTHGYYEFADIHSGVYQLQVGDQRCVIRVWAPGSAPPAARPHLTFVRADSVVRGQSGMQRALYDDPGRLAGLGMIGLTLGTITVIGIEATENEQSDWLSLQTTAPLSGSASP